MTAPRSMAEVFLCARCERQAADPDAYYPELCPGCNEQSYGEELDGSDLDCAEEGGQP